jgi:hypothetical protein
MLALLFLSLLLSVGVLGVGGVCVVSFFFLFCCSWSVSAGRSASAESRQPMKKTLEYVQRHSLVSSQRGHGHQMAGSLPLFGTVGRE